jgi:hypothetical protein
MFHRFALKNSSFWCGVRVNNVIPLRAQSLHFGEGVFGSHSADFGSTSDNFGSKYLLW